MSAEVIYCDNCGDDVAPGEVHAIASLPVAVASANAGESAMLCRTCAEMGECDVCGVSYVLGAADHCGECGSCWGCCECCNTCPECGWDVCVCGAHVFTIGQTILPLGTGAPRNTGTLGAPALERVCTGAIIDGRLIHDGGTCFLHEGHLHDGENEAPAEWCVFVLTNAPASYDYGYTVDTGRTEVRHRATCRLVMLSERHLRPQTDRYLSGAYMVEVW